MQRPEDIIRDILDRLHTAFADGSPLSDAEFWPRIESEIRHDWGGDRPYIAKTGETEITQKTTRDRAIVRDYRNGEHARFLARRYGISERRIQQIVKTG